MLSRGRVAGFAWSLFALALAGGCATHAVPSVSMETGSASDIASIAGVWEGQVWETPTHYLQGVRRITLNIAKDGSWTASSGGTGCASGMASIHRGLVILGGTRHGPDFCMPYSLASTNGRMKAVFDTSFKGRGTSAMIDLQRIRASMPEAAQAPTQP